MRIRKINKFLKFFLGENVVGITLAPFGIFLKEGYEKNETTLNHEKIHWKQQIEMLILPFYVWYVLEWLIKIPKYGPQAYYNISFEREAYTNQEEKTYLKWRTKWSWIGYLIKDNDHEKLNFI